MTDAQRRVYSNALAAGMHHIRMLVDVGTNPIDGEAVEGIWGWDDDQLVEADRLLAAFLKLVDWK